MKTRILSFIAIIVVIAAAAIFWSMRPIAPSHPALASSSLPKLLPLREFYANTESRWNYKLSPDGQYISWLESKWFKPALWVRPLKGDESTIFHTDDKVRWYAWSADSRYLLYQADRDGWENDVLVSIDTQNPSAEPRSYDFGKGTKAWYHHVPAQGGDSVIIAHNGRDRSKFDYFRLNLASGETETIGQSFEADRYLHFDKDGKVFARSSTFDDAGWQFAVRDENASGKWRVIAEGDMEERLSTFGEADENNEIFAVSSLRRDKAALVRLNLDDGTETVIDQHDVVDYGRVYYDQAANELLMSASWPGYQDRRFFNLDFESDIAKLDLPEKAAIHIISSTHDARKLLLSVEEAEAGYETFMLDRDTGELTSISKPSIARYRDELATVEPVFVPARDGLTIPVFLSRPKGVTEPAPMVIIIHGGPVSRTGWGFNSWRHWLTNRGYVVLDVNYRGSSGYGRRFREAAIGEVSRAMHTDIVDALKWAVDQGYADPEKVAVAGGSFGGLKTLTALTQNPELFAAGININGVSDLTTMLQQVPVYWNGWPAWYRKYLGDPAQTDQLADILDRSPITHAANLDDPLLVIQGSNDVRVIQEQADSMVNALKDAGKPVEYVVLDGAGHTFANWTWQQRLLTFRRMERFLAKNLGGRADGFDYAVVGAYIIP